MALTDLLDEDVFVAQAEGLRIDLGPLTRWQASDLSAFSKETLKIFGTLIAKTETFNNLLEGVKITQGNAPNESINMEKRQELRRMAGGILLTLNSLQEKLMKHVR